MAILRKHGQSTGEVVPVVEAGEDNDLQYASEAEVVALLQETRAQIAPMLDYLKDK